VSHSNKVIMNSHALGIWRPIQTAGIVDRGERQLPIQPDDIGLYDAVRKDDRIQVQLTEHGQDDPVIIER